ncbi:hypothetical protein ACFPM0_32230 [Pseudonocardia sulfidoxydans]|uniref:hypothetical protein n=1 Tax=Pseudonocardia sulfidoxydans TaxID=54011 RepID=UPI00361D5260
MSPRYAGPPPPGMWIVAVRAQRRHGRRHRRRHRRAPVARPEGVNAAVGAQIRIVTICQRGPRNGNHTPLP